MAEETKVADVTNNRKFRLKIVTPTRTLFDEDIDMVVMRAVTGDIGIMRGHTEYATTLVPGKFTIYDNDQEQVLAVQSGYCEITPKEVIVLSDAAEWPDEIDIRRAELAKERAERRMQEQDSEVQIQRTAIALRRALVRIEVSSYPIIMRKK
jgi:F-type H+-transporting ATPase subunit epsilon